MRVDGEVSGGRHALRSPLALAVVTTRIAVVVGVASAAERRVATRRSGPGGPAAPTDFTAVAWNWRRSRTGVGGDNVEVPVCAPSAGRASPTDQQVGVSRRFRPHMRTRRNRGRFARSCDLRGGCLGPEPMVSTIPGFVCHGRGEGGAGVRTVLIWRSSPASGRVDRALRFQLHFLRIRGSSAPSVHQRDKRPPRRAQGGMMGTRA
jgi:hypothetical protein